MSQSSSRSQYRVRKRGSISTSRTRRTTNTIITKDTGASGAYNANFQQKLVDGGIYPYGYRFPDGRVPPKPDNWEEINHRLAQPRPSLSPFPEKRFDEFVQADADAYNENAVKDSVIPKLLAVGGPNGAQRNIRFMNLAPLHSYEKNELKNAQPDYYFGALPEQLELEVRNELSENIIPSTSTYLPIAPNFFLEAKGPDGSLAVATRQACYDGVHGTRAMQSLLSFGHDEPLFDNKAYTLSAIYHGGQIKMYSHYATQPDGPGTRSKTYMHQLRSFAITDTKTTHVQGLAALRNAATWAEEMRDTVIAHANKRAGQTTANTEEAEGGKEKETEVE
ncbi:hypothetical protein MMC11_007004 [Xylographa trunciseda]|nr:hypothetical protein [Xylographa trunciseda]